MFVVFRDELVDSDEIRKTIEQDTLFKVETDLTKASKREDVMAFKLSIETKKIDDKKRLNWEDDESVDYFFEKAESLTSDFLTMFPRYTVQASRAYKWDELDDTVKLVVVIANIDIKLKKLKLDILPRMLKQVD
ncbi:hypothetical protein [Peptostreptococcus equinus]|uniref:Uncharacterized protein n=1 Tax=Peptostreptococcus equinus TaxID=3003601 RepID=A0ABY7JPY4_9FIRM|nr:hypothetical protein [Peptostreptococcus sp. CBA3647]WAW14961.1 hypothetical protein O0R46_00425 [Peptostreptococcus sp. CBA3647]